MSEPDYPFESSEHERQRLMRQADLLSEATERLFRKAGIAPGMRVLGLRAADAEGVVLARVSYTSTLSADVSINSRRLPVGG